MVPIGAGVVLNAALLIFISEKFRKRQTEGDFKLLILMVREEGKSRELRFPISVLESTAEKLRLAVRLQNNLKAALLTLGERRSSDLFLMATGAGVLHLDRAGTLDLNAVVKVRAGGEGVSAPKLALG